MKTCTGEAKITFTYRLRRTVKVRLVSFPFYGQPFFGTLRKRLKNCKSTAKRRLKNGQRTAIREGAKVRTSHDRANGHQQCCWRVMQSAGKSYMYDLTYGTYLCPSALAQGL